MVTFLAAALLAAPAAADIVHLKNGRTLEGKVRPSGANFIVDIGYGETVIPRSEVERVEKKAAPVQAKDDSWDEVLRLRETALDLRRASEEMEEARSEREAKIERLKAQRAAAARGGRLNEVVSQILEETQELEKADKTRVEASEAMRAYFSAFQELRRRAGSKGLDDLAGDFERKAVPSEVKGGHIVVTAAMADGKSVRLMVDTGATMTMVTESAAARLGLERSKAHGRFTATVADGRKVEAWMIRVPSLTVGDATVPGAELAVLPSSAFEDLDGLLGMSFLRNFGVELAGGKLVLTSLK